MFSGLASRSHFRVIDTQETALSHYSHFCTNTAHLSKITQCRVWVALRFKDRMVKVIMDVSALKDQKKGIVLQSTVLLLTMLTSLVAFTA